MKLFGTSILTVASIALFVSFMALHPAPAEELQPSSKFNGVWCPVNEYARYFHRCSEETAYNEPRAMRIGSDGFIDTIWPGNEGEPRVCRISERKPLFAEQGSPSWVPEPMRTRAGSLIGYRVQAVCAECGACLSRAPDTPFTYKKTLFWSLYSRSADDIEVQRWAG